MTDTLTVRLRDARGRPRPNPSAIVQNAALGAAAIWIAACRYADDAGQPMPVMLSFLILPMVFHAPTRLEISGTRQGSGLAKLASKFKGREDDLLAIHLRALLMRELSLDAIAIAKGAKLVSVDYERAMITPDKPPGIPTQSGSAKSIIDTSSKLGNWFSRLPLGQIATLLRVEF
jgi:Family of unknown function (DUF6521)